MPMKIYKKSCCPQTFQELHGITALQHSLKQQKQPGNVLKYKKEKKTKNNRKKNIKNNTQKNIEK